MLLIHWRHDADDRERTAGADLRLIRNRQAQPHRAGLAKLRPIEVHAALAGLLEHDPVVGFNHFHHGLLLAARHRVRHGVQVGAVHRVHDVVDGVAVVDVPMRKAEEVTVLVAGQFFGQAQRADRVVELGRSLVAKPQEDGTGTLLHRVAAHAGLAFHGARVDSRYAGYRTLAVHFNAVVPASHMVAQVPTHRQARTAMRAAVFQRMHLAGGVTPQHDVLAQTRDAHRGVFHIPRRRHRIPVVAQTGVDARFLLRFLVAFHCLPLLMV